MTRNTTSVERNREPILAVLRRVLPGQGQVLEVASGSGEHAAYYAERFPGLCWQPSDQDPAALASIEARVRAARLDNLKLPLRLDVCEATFGLRADAMLNMNMIHISPWATCEGLMKLAASALSRGGLLYMYGPFIVIGRATAAGNLKFDASLRKSNPEWGIRRLEQVVACAQDHGLRLERSVDMPASNLSLVFRKPKLLL